MYLFISLSRKQIFHAAVKVQIILWFLDVGGIYDGRGRGTDEDEVEEEEEESQMKRMRMRSYYYRVVQRRVDEWKGNFLGD